MAMINSRIGMPSNNYITPGNIRDTRQHKEHGCNYLEVGVFRVLAASMLAAIGVMVQIKEAIRIQDHFIAHRMIEWPS
jgi:hypothetical protein